MTTGERRPEMVMGRDSTPWRHGRRYTHLWAASALHVLANALLVSRARALLPNE